MKWLEALMYGSLKQDVVDDQRDKLSQLEGKVAELEDQLRKKDDLIAVNVCVWWTSFCTSNFYERLQMCACVASLRRVD